MIDPTEADIERRVSYVPHEGAPPEYGAITSFNASLVFVRYDGDQGSKGTPRGRLFWADAGLGRAAAGEPTKPKESLSMSGPMVRQLLTRKKTMTRRLFIPPAPFDTADDITVELATGSIPAPWKPGDRIFVRENFAAYWGARHPGGRIVTSAQVEQANRTCVAATESNPLHVHYEADQAVDGPTAWTLAHDMPRWASRITLNVTACRVERLQEIGLQDVLAEGCEVRQFWLFGADKERRDEIGRAVFNNLWDELYGKSSWRENPWVSATTFTVLVDNIDSPAVKAA